MTPTLIQPLVESVVFENSAHLAMVEEPERYRDVIESFLSRAEGAGG